ncbi:MAG: HAD family hydrolase [Pseudobutyrivibrio sp.]|nr:HAD family hydrolase [Pseudobutyrivibrio sp.]
MITDGLIFDMDGTIWDNTELFAQSWNRAANDCGYPDIYTADTLKGLFGRTMKEIADASIPDEDPEKRYACLELCEEYEMADFEKSDVDTTYQGLKETLIALSEKTKLFIVSNCQSGYIELFLNKSGLGYLFTDYICYGDNGLGKADNIRHIVEKHNLKTPAYIGDIQGDKNACDEANVGFIWASYGYGDTMDECVAEVKDIRELVNIVE